MVTSERGRSRQSGRRVAGLLGAGPALEHDEEQPEEGEQAAGEEQDGEGDPGGGAAEAPPQDGAPDDGDDGEAAGDELPFRAAPEARSGDLIAAAVRAGDAHTASVPPGAGRRARPDRPSGERGGRRAS